MSSFVLAAAEGAVSYAFPQVGAALQGARLAKLTWKISKAAICYFTGDMVGGTANLALAAGGQAACEAARHACAMECVSAGFGPALAPPVMGACLGRCEAIYRACMSVA